MSREFRHDTRVLAVIFGIIVVVGSLAIIAGLTSPPMDQKAAANRFTALAHQK